MMDLETTAAALGITLLEHLGGEKGRWYPDRRAISLRRGLGPTNRQCTLAHELGHAVHRHLAGDLPQWVIDRQEREADEWAARALISPVEYALAEELNSHPGAIARELGVTVGLLEVWRRLQERVAV